MKSNEEIIDLLLDHPDGKEVRATAQEITDIRLKAGFKVLLPEVFTDQLNQVKLKTLFNDFRQQVNALLSIDLQQNEAALYTEIIHPMIDRLLSRSA